MAKLVLLSEGLTGRSFELKAERITVGRADDNDFAIAEGSVSSHHGEILLKGTTVTVKDLGSTNGTFIAGERITEAELKPGQILRLGHIEMRLETGTPASPEKKKLEHTMVIPQGVKLNELDSASKTAAIGSNPAFAKKSDKVNRIFVTVIIVLGVIVVGLLVWALGFARTS